MRYPAGCIFHRLGNDIHPAPAVRDILLNSRDLARCKGALCRTHFAWLAQAFKMVVTFLTDGLLSGEHVTGFLVDPYDRHIRIDEGLSRIERGEDGANSILLLAQRLLIPPALGISQPEFLILPGKKIDLSLEFTDPVLQKLFGLYRVPLSSLILPGGIGPLVWSF
ncbi:hypothetical protein DSECCO2_541460 [anaerobic digester metagenome]